MTSTLKVFPIPRRPEKIVQVSDPRIPPGVSAFFYNEGDTAKPRIKEKKGTNLSVVQRDRVFAILCDIAKAYSSSFTALLAACKN